VKAAAAARRVRQSSSSGESVSSSVSAALPTEARWCQSFVQRSGWEHRAQRQSQQQPQQQHSR